MWGTQEVTALQCNNTMRVESHPSHQRASGAKVRAEVRRVTGRRKSPFYQTHFLRHPDCDRNTAICIESDRQLLMCWSVKRECYGQGTWTNVSISDYLISRRWPDLVQCAHSILSLLLSINHRAVLCKRCPHSIAILLLWLHRLCILLS